MHMRNTYIRSGASLLVRTVRHAAAVLVLSAVALPAASVFSSLADTGSAIPTASAQAQNAGDCKDNQKPVENGAPVLPCQKNDVSSCPQGSCIFQTYINPAIKVVSALVGIGVTISIIIGGIQYASSADSPQKVSAAKQRIVRAIFILLAYFFFLAFMNWVIPGGINGTP